MKHGTFWLVFGFLPSTGKTPSGKWWPFQEPREVSFCKLGHFPLSIGKRNEPFEVMGTPWEDLLQCHPILVGGTWCWEPIPGSYHRFPMVSCSRCVFAHFRCFLKMETCKDGCQAFFLTTIVSSIHWYNSFFWLYSKTCFYEVKLRHQKFVRYIEWCKLGVCKLAGL